MKIANSSALVGLTSRRGINLTGEKVRLREKKMSDARNDYRWQSDPDLAGLDATQPITLSYAVYLLDYSVELRSPRYKRYPLAIDTLLDGTHIGNCTIYDIDEKNGQAQLGILIGERDYWNQGYGSDAVNTLVGHIFRNTSLDRLYLKTLDWNIRAQKSFAKSGFTPAGFWKHHHHNFRMMYLTRQHWQELVSGNGSRPDE